MQGVVCYAECNKILSRLIKRSSHTIYYQVAYDQYQFFFVYLINHIYFLQLILPLLSFNSWIQCPYHVRLEWSSMLCNSRRCLVRRQLLINAIFEGDWTIITAAYRFFVPNIEEFFLGLVALLQQCGLCCQENSDGGLAEFLGRRLQSPSKMAWIKSCRLTSWYIKTANSVMNYITSNLTFEVHVIRQLNSWIVR